MVDLIHEDPGIGPIITHIGASGFRTQMQRFSAGILLTPIDAVDWAAPDLQGLTLDAVQAILAIEPLPEFLLLGTGVTLTHPPQAFTAALDARGIGLEVMDSAAAARAWRLLRSEGRWIAGALYPL
jgi:uncharacterized protein